MVAATGGKTGAATGAMVAGALARKAALLLSCAVLVVMVTVAEIFPANAAALFCNSFSFSPPDVVGVVDAAA